MRRKRFLFGPLGLALFAIQFVVLQISFGGARYVRDTVFWIAALSSVLVWLLFGTAARRPIAKALISLFAAAILVFELLFFRYYYVFPGDDAIVCALSMWDDVKPVVHQMLPGAALGTLLLGACEFALLLRAPRLRSRTIWSLSAIALGFAAYAVPRQMATPDLRALWSLRLLLRPNEAKAHTQINMPPVESVRERLPNVLFVLSESVRESDYSLAELELMTPAWRTLVPERVELREIRSLASYTAISVNALLSGIMPLGSRASVAETPLVFDYLRATRAGTMRPRVLYWSVQGSSSFERSQPREIADSVALPDDVLGGHFASVEEMVEIGADSRLADWIARRLPAEPRPLFLLAHLIDTHAPYHVDENSAPFKPYSHTATWSGLGALHNAYRNAIAVQDRSVAAIVRTFVETVGREPYIIFFTSDHGESFGEHHAIHHGQNLYDEQIHVPAWIAFGNGALLAEQEKWLRIHAGDFLTQLDLLPTLLDAYGVLDDFGMLRARKKLLGRSLLRPFSSNPAILPISNCTALFPCPLLTYGVLKQGFALLAQPWNDSWRCAALGTTSNLMPLDIAACAELKTASIEIYPTLPNGQPNR